MSAVWGRDLRTVEVLMDAGADTSLRNNKGETALMIAQGLNESSIVKALSTKDGSANSKEGAGRP
jgi:ankyrin repeat protein